MKTNQAKNNELVAFWNDAFKGLEPSHIEEKDLQMECPFGDLIAKVAKSASSIIDYGCGDGIVSFFAAFKNDNAKILGIDPSKNAIEFASKTAALSGLKNLSFEVGKEEKLKEMKEASLDAIICSNVLDVIPLSSAMEIIKEFNRILKVNGHVLLKTNFYIDEEMASSKKFDINEDNEVYVDGVLRLTNLPSEEWLKRFEGFAIEEENTFERIPNGPKDRVFLFKKR